MTIFITGGSRGIGRGIVQAALSAGHDVAFTFCSNRAAADEVLRWASDAAPNVTCKAYQLDVSDSTAVDRVGDMVTDDFDTIDAVVSNAGIVRDMPAVQMSDEDWSAVLNTNLSGSFFVARYFLMGFLAAGRGRLVFVSSLAQNGISGQSNYSASKGGIVSLAKALAKEYGRKNITSNVVVPGTFDTDMTRKAMSAEYKKFWTTYCPAGRVGELDELAQAVLFLASDASSFINGQELWVTGGLDWAA